MISILQNNDVYEVRFPYNADIVNMVKEVPGRRWVPDSKMWTIPLSKYGFLLSKLRNSEYANEIVVTSNEDLNVNESLNDAAKVPEIDISDATFYVQEGKYVYKHQKDTLRFAKWRYLHGLKSGFLLADSPGAGKTLSVLNTAMYFKEHYGSKHCLIIACVNSAKYNWKEDIVKHTNGKEVPYILGTRLKKDKVTERLDTGSKEKLEDLTCMKMYGDKGCNPLPYFIVLNIEAVRMKVGRSYPIADKLIELVNSGEIDIIALDEIHRNCSMTSSQGKQLLRIKQKTKQIQWIPMTGTPITNNPTNVFLPLRLVDGHTSNSFYMWSQNYCVYGGFGNHEVIGYKNMPDLKQMLQPNMLRRLKSDILDLPPKIHFTEYVENSPYQAALYKKVVEGLLQEKGEILHSLNPMTKLLKLRQVNGSPELVDDSIVMDKTYLSKNSKMQRTLDLLDDILSNPGEKVVIFSNWVEPLRTLYRYVKQHHKVCCYTGTMSQEDRELHKKTFISNPEYRVMIGTVGALGTSHTLTVARNVIFYDSPWNPSDVEQCEDRCHRPGTSDSVNIYTLITKGTVDEKVHQILSRKEGTADYIVDNSLDLRMHPELLDILLDISSN